MAAAPQKKTFSQKISKPTITRRSVLFPRSPRLLWFGLALLLFGLFTLLAHHQAPRPDPFQPVPALSWDWVKYPFERNAFKRLSVITSGLNDVLALPNSEKVWAVGDKGMIVHSDNGGETWVRQEVGWEAVADSLFTQSSSVQEQQQDDNSTEAFDARQQNALRSNVAQKGLNPAPKQANVPVRTPITKPVAPQKTPPALCSVHFVDAITGWAVGWYGTILTTHDGGANWQAQTSMTSSSLNSVHFVNAAIGWAVGDAGTILATRDGGANWQAQTSGTTRQLESVHFVNATTGWVVGYGGTILATRDGGATWQAQTSGTSSWLYSVHFVNAATGWAVGDPGTIIATRDGGATWQAQTSGTRLAIHSVHFLDTNNGWAVSWDGRILVTKNSGMNWQTQKSGIRSPLNSVHFVNVTTGWAVGEDGSILSTSNGGVTWEVRASEITNWFVSVRFANEMMGRVVDRFGTILVTSNGGATLQLFASDTTKLLTFSNPMSWPDRVHFVTEMTGFAMSRLGTMLMTNNGGITWQSGLKDTTNSLSLASLVIGATGMNVGHEGWQLGGTRNPLNRDSTLTNFHFVNATTGWAVGYGGTILMTRNGGKSWQKQTSSTKLSLLSVHFVDDTTGWAVGYGGTILFTRNGGAVWQAQKSGTITDLFSVYFVNASSGWVVGRCGIVLSTSNGGQTWKDPTLPYSRSFAPWYYLSLLLITPLLYLAFRKSKPIEAAQKTVADMLVSDRPIAAGDPDPLEFNAIARGLSRFLRNENTQPPLTIAITGEWGSGKSSLMNLLKADLERYGFRPVWFNAWHHQKEEHLLAALLQNIRKQALPRWWRPEGMSFRARLFWRRVRRYRVLALLLLAGFAMAVGYFAADHPARLHDAVQQIEKIFTGDTEKTILGWLQDKLAALGKTSVLALLSSLGAALLVLWRGLRAFGVNPANLMASFSSNFKLSEVKAQMGFRHDFSREFSEVTAALNPRTMLILIDDLDRCRPENVLEVLEAVNFLVSSGDCYVVMGLDLTRVERCVGLGFKDVAEELIDDPEEEGRKDEGKIRRAEFARQYLEKLINIEVPVPQPQPEQSQNLIVPPQPVAPKPLTWWQNLLQISAPVVRKIAPVLLVAAVLVGSMLFSVKYFSPQRETPGATTVAQATARATTSPTQPTPSTPTTSPQRETPVDSSRGTGELIQPVKEPTSFAFVYVILALILGLGIWRLSIPTDFVVKDSPEFIDALKIWHPLLIAKRNTPRSVKRFVNRVRYFAMRQSAETEAHSVWQKLAVWTGFKQKEGAKQVEAVPESILVALSAMGHYNPNWVNDDELWKGFGQEFEASDQLDDKVFPIVLDAIAEHGVRFDSWPPNAKDRELLLKLSAGIRIN